MSAKKKVKARTARPSGKKGIAKKAVIRTASKGAVAKRSRKAPAARSVRVDRRRPRQEVTPLVAEPLFGSAELEARLAERRPIKKAPAAKPARPPASLPIPQATFFF